MKAVGKTAQETVKTVAVESVKEIIEAGVKEGASAVATNVAKLAVAEVAKEGTEGIVTVGAQESIKRITEEIAVKQGGNVSLINLGKCVPFIGAALSGIIISTSTALLGNQIINKFDEDFDKNRERNVKRIKSKIYGLNNVIVQLKQIIRDEIQEAKF